MRRSTIKITCVFVVFYLMFCIPLFSEEKPIITVLDFESSGISKAEVLVFIDFVTSHIVDTGEYRVIDRMQREALLNEIEFSVSECSDESCQLQIGKLLSATRIIVGSIGKVGSRFILNIKLIDVETGETLKTGSEKYMNIDEMIDDSKRLAFSFVGKKAVIVEEDIEEVEDEIITEPEIAYILFSNLKEESTVLVNGSDVTGSVKKGRLEVDPGKYKIVVSTPQMVDFKKNFSLKTGEQKKISIKYKKIIAKDNSSKKSSSSTMLSGFILGGSGLALTAAGLILNMDDIAAGMTDSYTGYTSIKNISTSAFIGGTPLLLAGGAMAISSLLSPAGTIKQEIDNLRLWGIIIGGTGVAVTGVSLVLNMDDIAAGMTDSYTGYSSLKNITASSVTGGLNIALTGGAMFLSTILTPNDIASAEAATMRLYGIMLSGCGVAVTAANFVLNMDDIAADLTESYTGYKGFKDITLSGMIGGAGMVLSGGIMFVTSLFTQSPATPMETKPEPLSFDIGYKDNFSLNLKYSY